MRCLGIYDNPHWIIFQIANAHRLYNQDVEYCLMGQVEFEWIMQNMDSKSWLQNFDLIHFFCPWAAGENINAVHGHLPIAATIHHVVDSGQYYFVNKADVLFFVSSEWFNYFDDKIDSNVIKKMWPNGIDTDVFHPSESTLEKVKLREKLNIDRYQNILVGYCANRSSDYKGRKGINLYLKSVLELAKSIPNVSFILIGKGWENDVKSLKCKGVSIYYFPYEDDINNYASILRCLDIFWVTSKTEGGPMPAFEALASGAFLVTTPVGMIPDHLLDPPVCEIINEPTADLIVNRTKEIMSFLEKKRVLNDEGVQRIKERLTVQKCFSGIQQVYLEAIEKFKLNNSINHDSCVYPVPDLLVRQGRLLMECDYIRESMKVGYIPPGWYKILFQMLKNSRKSVFCRKSFGLMKDRIISFRKND